MKTNSNTIVIFSHWFGVRKDSRWFFDDIANKLNEWWIQTIQFDYNEFNEATKELYASSYSEQAVKLQQIIDNTMKKHPHKKIIILWHSQWCIIPSLCELKEDIWVILIAPFFHTEINEVIARHTKDPLNTFDITWVSTRKRTDWSTTIIPSNYRKERFATDPIKLYNTLAIQTECFLIHWLQDEIITFKKLHDLKNINIINIDGNHDFSREFRPKVIEQIIKIIWYLQIDQES